MVEERRCAPVTTSLENSASGHLLPSQTVLARHDRRRKWSFGELTRSLADDPSRFKGDVERERMKVRKKILVVSPLLRW